MVSFNSVSLKNSAIIHRKITVQRLNAPRDVIILYPK